MKKNILLLLMFSILVCCTDDEPQNTPPVCKFLSPSQFEQIVVGTPVNINLNVSDTDGKVENVKIFVNNIGVVLLENFPYNHVWSTTGLDTGKYIIRAECTDDKGGITIDEVEVIIKLPDNILPTCSILSPEPNVEIGIGSTVSINVDVDDVDGEIHEVAILINDETVSILKNPPYKYDWNTANADTGTYEIIAICKDDRGDTSTSKITVYLKEIFEVTDIEGNVYKAVKIGNQVWMAENLRVTKYADGTNIPLVWSNSSWVVLGNNNFDDAYCFYNNDSHDSYGAIYTWAAAMGGNTMSSSLSPSEVQGVCPDGWHLPSDAEWKELEIYLGLSQSEADINGWRGHELAAKLKSTSGWLPYSGVTESNESGFSAKPGGYRSVSNGTFIDKGAIGYWWSSEEYDSNSAWYRVINYNKNEVNRSVNRKSYGFSVRCVRD